MQALSPARRPSLLNGHLWFRLAWTDDGLLCLETISDQTLSRPGLPAAWAFCGEVPLPIARLLQDDANPDQVTKVLDLALCALGFSEAR